MVLAAGAGSGTSTRLGGCAHRCEISSCVTFGFFFTSLTGNDMTGHMTASHSGFCCLVLFDDRVFTLT